MMYLRKLRKKQNDLSIFCIKAISLIYSNFFVWNKLKILLFKEIFLLINSNELDKNIL